jgi:IclR family transcriptional regulator, acetate operon repressor
VLQEHLEQVVEQAVPTQQPGRVGGKLEAGADLGELLGPLQHPHPQPGTAQQQRGGPDVRFVDGIEGDQPLRVGLRTGARMPAYCTSGGKAMLADLDWSEVEALHPHGLPRWPYAKLRDLPSLRRQLARVRRQGYGVNAQESEAGLTAFGVSIRARSGRPIAALSVALPTARFDPRHEPELAAQLMEARSAAAEAVAVLQ